MPGAKKQVTFNWSPGPTHRSLAIHRLQPESTPNALVFIMLHIVNKFERPLWWNRLHKYCKDVKLTMTSIYVVFITNIIKINLEMLLGEDKSFQGLVLPKTSWQSCPSVKQWPPFLQKDIYKKM